jgi:hypothetical protein
VHACAHHGARSPHRYVGALRETLEPLPESVRGGAQHGAGRGRRAETALDLEATVRAYLLGAQHDADEVVSNSVSCIAAAAAAGRGAGTAGGAAAGHVLEVTGRLATALMRRACTDEMAEARAAASVILHEYVEWCHAHSATWLSSGLPDDH